MNAAALETIGAIVDHGGDVDDVLRRVVAALVEAGGCAWAGILFAEDGELVLGPQAGQPDGGYRLLERRLPDPASRGPVIAEDRLGAGRLVARGQIDVVAAHRRRAVASVTSGCATNRSA